MNLIVMLNLFQHPIIQIRLQSKEYARGYAPERKVYTMQVGCRNKFGMTYLYFMFSLCIIIMLYKQGFVYIMSNKYRTTFYIGVTADLRVRVWQHLNWEGSAFVKKYRLYDLLYYERFECIADAIDREKQLKNWHHDWKDNLIKSLNPEMKDLKDQLGD
jgi:putative endonuclease